MTIDDELEDLIQSLDELYDNRAKGLYDSSEGMLRFAQDRQRVYTKLNRMGVSLKLAREKIDRANLRESLEGTAILTKIIYHTSILQAEYFHYGDHLATDGSTIKVRLDRKLVQDTKQTLAVLWDLRRQDRCRRRQ